MKPEIKEYLETFKLNPPVFELDISNDGVIDLVPTTRCSPPDPGDDPIKMLINEIAIQRFDVESKSYVIDHEPTMSYLESKIRLYFTEFVELHSNSKSPRQTKLWRWLAHASFTSEANDGLYMLYKYIAPHCKNSHKYSNPDITHRDNTLLILEAMLKRHIV